MRNCFPRGLPTRGSRILCFIIAQRSANMILGRRPCAECPDALLEIIFAMVEDKNRRWPERSARARAVTTLFRFFN